MSVNIVISVDGYRNGVPILLSPSSSLSGQVHLSLTALKIVNYLKIQLTVVSHSRVRYQAGSTKNHYDDVSRILANDEIPLMYASHGQGMQLSSGNHVLPFSFPMGGRNLPSSYQHTPGNCVSWTLNVAADFKGHVFDKKHCVDLLVDFPRYIRAPKYMEPMVLEDDKNICCLCCADGPISLYGSINRTGVAPGSSIEVYARCDNISSRPIQFACKLDRRVFMGSFRTDAIRRAVTEVLGPKVPPRKKGVEWRIRFQIPSDLRPATIEQPENFTVTYFLQVEVRIPKSLDLELVFPITIGTERTG